MGSTKLAAVAPEPQLSQSKQQDRSAVVYTFSKYDLELGSNAYQNTTGTSQNNRHLGFIPAFIDRATGTIYLSRYRGGKLSPFHQLDGLPAEVILRHDKHGHVEAVLPTIEAGFCRAGRYYTREEAKLAASEEVK